MEILLIFVGIVILGGLAYLFIKHPPNDDGRFHNH